MATRKQFLKVMAEHGGTVEEIQGGIEVFPPEGFVWGEDHLTSLLGLARDGDDRAPMSEVYDDLIQRMKYGAVPKPEDE